MALTVTQRTIAQHLLIEELEARRKTQPLLLVDSIIDGTAKAKLKMLLTQKANALQATYDTFDADAAGAKVELAARIAEFDAMNKEIV